MTRLSRRHRALATALALAALCAASVPSLAAQATGTIRGRVTNASSQRPLSGAPVAIPGTNRRAVTDETGSYQIANVPAGSRTVRAEMIGFAPVERAVSVTAGGTATADFALSESAISLDALVVTATGEARTREIATSMAKISSQNIENAPVSNPQDVIAGRAPGVTVMSNSGQPGAGGTIRIRGTNSVSQGNSPLIYVDGVRIYHEGGPVALAARQGSLPLNDISAEDIESIEIVKGAAATTLYGTEASGGVIQIFTKRGTAGPPVWSAEVTTGMSRMGHVGPSSDRNGLFMNRCSGDGLFGVNYDLPRSRTKPDTVRFVDVTCPSGGSWLKDGGIRRYNLSVRGGAENMTYFLSGNYGGETGVIAPAGGGTLGVDGEPGWNKDGGIRGNFSFQPSGKLEFSLNSAYTRRVTRWVPDGNNGSGLLLNVSRGPFNNFKGGKGDQCSGVQVTCLSNGYILTQQNFNRGDHFITGLTMNYRPTERLSNRLSVGYDFNSQNNQTVYPYGYPNVALGLIWAQDWEHSKLSVDYVGSFQDEIASLASTFSWGAQLFEDRDTYTRVNGENFAGPGEPTLESAAKVLLSRDRNQRVINAGLFLQEMVGWRDRLFVTAGMRVDGNSAFGEEFGLQMYPKLSASYVLSDHDFWPQWWDAMKLRAAMGWSGKAPGAFDAVKTWDPIAGDEGTPGVSPRQLGNPNLGPERTREYEAGMDASLFGGRLGLDLTAYRQNTFDALIPVEYPPSQGFIFSQLENVGELQNTGFEAQLNGGVLQTSMLDWRARVNYSQVRSEVIDVDGREISTGSGTFVKEGFAIPAYFGAKITNPDRFEDPLVEENAFIGGGYPTRTVGVGTTLTFRDRVTLDALGEYQGGHYLANWVGYQNARRGTWAPCHDVQEKLFAAQRGNTSALEGVTARQRAQCAIDRTKMNDDYWIEPADFFKLRTVSLTYELPSRWLLGGRSASVTLAGRNLFKSSGYSGTDPEVYDARDASNGDAVNELGRRDYYNLPPVRSVMASVRVSF
ncbi:MAG TPA: SusC/RagA family TonB-linked outer membrane protein [Longimicrobiaceae bacterium]|nr:SusC/RagA family TonB-linked outer membrane protein [Longimicrobiaceae bacterium]